MSFATSGTTTLIVISALACFCVILGVVYFGRQKRKGDLIRMGQPATLFRLFTDAVWKTDADLQLARTGDQQDRSRLVRRALRRRRSLKLTLVILAFFLAVIALARPQWGILQEEIHSRGVEIVFLVDTSYSMKAEDMAPSRLEKAKSEIMTLLDQLPGNRAALVGFASTSRLHCPLTLDFRGLRSILEHSLQMGPGTDVQQAVEKGVFVLARSEARTKVIVILSDGEGHTGDIDLAVETAKKAGIRIYTIGVGTPEGAPIPEGSGDESGYKKRNGELVWSKLEEETLTDLAEKTGGKYFRASATEEETALLTSEIMTLEESEFSQTVTTRREERFGIFLFLSIVLLAVESVLGDFRPIRWEHPDE